jgi:UDP-glucose 4-epimerase
MLRHIIAGSKAILLRDIVNVFGQIQRTGRGQRVISEWIHSIFNGTMLKLYGTDEISRDFIYIDDLVAALSMCISRAQLANTYHIEYGVSANLRQVLQILQEVENTNFQVELVPKRAIDRMSTDLDISRAIDDLDWKPELSLRQAVEKSWNSVMSK